ncbi:MAG TPA: hypothetical protein PLV68_21690, partial [Ilumatobacteraceae bacterium]|nr:hypothetical protein [Ilumatobacteraceae bacterium]
MTSVVAVLTNEAHTVAADSTGSVTAGNFSGCGGTMKVYRGLTQVTTGITWSIAVNASSLTASIDVSGQYSATAQGGWATSSRSAVLTLRATHADFVLDKDFTVTKSVAGAAGVSSYGVAVIAPSQVFRTAKDGVVTPSSILLSANVQNLASLGAVAYSWSTVPNIGSGTSSTFSVSSAALGANNSVEVTLQATAASTTVTDKVTLVRLAEGTNAVQGVMSNEAHTFAANSSGTVTSYAGSGTEIRVYEGATELAYQAGGANGTWTVSTAQSGIQVGSLTDSGSYLTVGQHSN